MSAGKVKHFYLLQSTLIKLHPSITTLCFAMEKNRLVAKSDSRKGLVVLSCNWKVVPKSPLSVCICVCGFCFFAFACFLMKSSSSALSFTTVM